MKNIFWQLDLVVIVLFCSKIGGYFAPQETFGTVWRHSCLSQLVVVVIGDGGVLAPSGERSEMLYSPSQPRVSYLAQNVSMTKRAEKYGGERTATLHSLHPPLFRYFRSGEA